MNAPAAFIAWFDELGIDDLPRVGGKNASLGEMIRALRTEGVRVPDGFAVTVDAYWAFVRDNALEQPIEHALDRFHAGERTLEETGAEIRALFMTGRHPEAVAAALAAAYRQLGERAGRGRVDVAVRSSATAEDLPEASFAGQQESFLNVTGEEALADACRRCFASLFTDRAISYRENQKIDHRRVALSIGVQIMVRADSGAAGVMFSVDTETGFPDVVVINANFGLGETVVRGTVDPDEYRVFKPLLGVEGRRPVIDRVLGRKEQRMVYGRSAAAPTRLKKSRRRYRDAFVLSDDEILQLARWAVRIERHYGKPMDMEWAKDGHSGDLHIVQARPETVQSRRDGEVLETYRIKDKGRTLLVGLSVGDAIAAGTVCRLESAADIDRFRPGSILVTAMTDPDWVPIMKRAAAIVTDHGGRTSHAAIVSRELGLPAVIGTGRATETLKEGQQVTVSCAEGDTGFVYEGIAAFEVDRVTLEQIPKTRTRVMLNVANPAGAFRWWRLPADGVGLARLEFIIGHHIRVHPMALLRPRQVSTRRERRQIAAMTRAWPSGAEYFIDRLACGIARIAAAHYPKPVVVRTSDFKTNEYASLLGGEAFEPEEENPMLGWRGASRYYSDGYRDGFALECRAIRRVREQIGLDNVIVMIPFCRSLHEADRVLDVMRDQGLARGKNGLEVYVMCEIPSNVILAAQFAERFDGFSIGSNDLTQLVLGVDRDSERLSDLFDEDNEAVRQMIATAIESAHKAGRHIGLCGQAPSDRPEFAGFLVGAGIDAISVTPDSFLSVKQHVAAAEASGES
jgi:pyruvate, water dikinase